MRRSQYFLPAVFVCISAISLSFLPGNVSKTNSVIDRYSLDPLPEVWKENKSLVKAIDIVITASVKELEESLACTNCNNAPYSVSLLVDSPVIMKQTYEDIGNKKNSGGYNYECKTTFRFKSSLAVYNASQHGVAKVLVTDPQEDEYTSIKKFNLFSKNGAAKLTPEQYIAANTREVGPSMDDMMKYAEKKIYVLRDDIHKLKNRH